MKEKKHYLLGFRNQWLCYNRKTRLCPVFKNKRKNLYWKIFHGGKDTSKIITHQMQEEIWYRQKS